MRSRGILSFVLVLLFIAMEFAMLGAQNEIAMEIGKTQALLMQMEKASYVRNEIEQNSDFLIERVMENELKGGNYDPETIRGKICSALFGYFTDVESAYAAHPSIKFYSAFASSSEYQELPLKVKAPLQESDICANSKVIVVKDLEGYSAEFSYTGGIFKDRAVFAEIAYGNYLQVFAIPFDYAITAEA
ncbi:MAG: hypothetical protein HYW05_02195 [Candidatus Diapherotrites archaeon]|nr:hypothetical protein [Candidatus Diapherotrites archaeon]